MAESTSVALVAAPIPSSADISRAEKLVRERFLHGGEDATVALAPGSPRRRALDQALAELEGDPKAKHPSTAWRREFSLLLGLERLLSEDEPKLADGTALSAHQVDALSGTLTALLAAAQSATPNGNGSAAASASPELLASADILGPDDVVAANDSAAANAPAAGAGAAPAPIDDAEVTEEDEDESPRSPRTRMRDDVDEDDEDLGPIQRAAPDEDQGEDEDDLDDVELIAAEEEQEDEPEPDSDPDEEPRDWVEGEEESVAEAPED